MDEDVQESRRQRRRRGLRAERGAAGSDGARSDGLSLRLARTTARVRSDLPLALLDALLVACAYLSILLVRFDGSVPDRYRHGFVIFVPAAIVVHLMVNWVWGLYGQMWAHASVQEARRVLLAGATAVAALAALFLPGTRQVPLSVVVLGAMVATAAVGWTRFQSRLFAFRRAERARDRSRVVVIGAGESGGGIVREMFRHPDAGFRPVALIDDDSRKHGLAVNGIRVIGGIDALPDAVRHYGAEQALLAIPSATGDFVRRVANAADAVDLTLKVLPSVSELVGGRVSVRDVRDLSITDLLGRQQVTTDLSAVRGIIEGRRVLVTGGGGSIGAEIARQVAACQPEALLLLDHDETHLYEAAMSLPLPCDQLLADVRDRELIQLLFARYRPDVVFHAAAHKHVPLLQRHPREAVTTNVLGTRNVVAAARQVGVERFVFVSTDKAVHPTSVMGASKWFGEQIVLASASAGEAYCAVRFGNVLGSRGSVIPTFAHQIQSGGPVTVTDARMTRFFMSIGEAVQLVLQAAAFATRGEVFMLDMGEPVRIIDLAQRMIRLSGRQVGTEVPLRISGIREGEKLAEELHTPYETTQPTAHPSIVALHPPRLHPTVLENHLRRLSAHVTAYEDEAATELLLGLANGGPPLIDLTEPAVGSGAARRHSSGAPTSDQPAIWETGT